MDYLPRSSRFGRQRKSFSFKKFGSIIILAIFLLITAICVRYYTLYLALKEPSNPTIWRPEGVERAQYLLAGLSEGKIVASTLISIGPGENSPVFILRIPPETLMASSSEEKDSFASIYQNAGREEAVLRLNSLLGGILPVSHYIFYDLEGIADILTVMEKVELNLPEGFQTRYGKTEYIFAPGKVTITQDNLMALIAAEIDLDGAAFWAEKSLLVEVFNNLFSLNHIGHYVRNKGSISNTINTDLPSRQLAKFRNTLQAMEWEGRQYMVLPGHMLPSDTGNRWEPNPRLIELRLRQIAANIPDYDRSLLVVDVFNGNGVGGFAAGTATRLKEENFFVGQVANAETSQLTHIYYREEYLLAAMEIAYLLEVDAVLIEDSYTGSENPVAIILGLDLVGR